MAKDEKVSADQVVLYMRRETRRFAHRAEQLRLMGNPAHAVENLKRFGQLIKLPIQQALGFTGHIVRASAAMHLAQIKTLQITDSQLLRLPLKLMHALSG